MEALPKQEEPVSTLYHYVPTEPSILSPYVPVISPEQEIAKLREYKKLSEERFDKMGRLIEQLLKKSPA